MIDFSGLEQQYKLPQGLLSAVMRQESGGNPNAVSPAGAVGAFQFMPATAQQYGIDPRDPNQSAQGAARMFGDLSQKYQGDLSKMLAGYNWGQGNVDRRGLQSAPAETQNYISSITNNLGQPGGASQDTLIGSGGTPKIDLLLEAEKRGILPPDKKALLDEARSRGLITGGTPQKQPDIAPSIGRTALDQSLQGATAGFADEPMDFLGATYAKYAPEAIGGRPDLFKDQSLADTYADARNASKQRMTSEFQNNPVSSIVSNIGGSILTGSAIGSTGIGQSLGNVMKSGGTLARIGKGALAGAATGGLYGAGSADDGNRLQGAEMGAATGGVLGGALPAVGAGLVASKEGAQNIFQGVMARSPEFLQDIASKAKGAAGDIYNQMRNMGVNFNDDSANKLVSNISNALSNQDFIEGLNPKTLSIVNALKAKAESGQLGLGNLDQYRRMLSRVGASEDGVSAGTVKGIINDFTSQLSGTDLKGALNYTAEDLAEAKNELDSLNTLKSHLEDSVNSQAQLSGKQGGFWRRKTITAAADEAKGLSSIKQQIANQKSLVDHIEGNIANAPNAQMQAQKAVSLLNQGRSQYAQASKFEDISDILAKAGGDPNKIKSGLSRFLANTDNTRGWSVAEMQGLRQAANSTNAESLLKGLGRFGFDPKNVFMPLVGGGGLTALAGGAAGGGLVAAGTAARQGQKFLARGKAENLMKIIESGGKTAAKQGTPITTGIMPAVGAGELSDLSNKLKKMGTK